MKYLQLWSLSLVVFFAIVKHSLAADVDDNPAVPTLTGSSSPAHDGSIRVAIVDSGVNYLLPEINQALARDQKGQVISFDFWDMDALPFDSHPGAGGRVQRHGTQTASLLIREAPYVKLVSYRYPRPDMTRMEALVKHASQHKVRIIGLPLGGNRIDPWRVFERVAALHPEILFIASAGNNGRNIDQEPVYPATLPLANLLVVTSADDFARPAVGSNWGRTSVDYLVPAEQQRVLGFSGDERTVSGSSYAVPRAMAYAARLLRDNPAMSVDDVLSDFARRFANGAAPKQVSKGYLFDPQFDPKKPIATEKLDLPGLHNLSSVGASVSNRYRFQELLRVPIEIFVVSMRWTDHDVESVLSESQHILKQCGILIEPRQVKRVRAPGYLRDLQAGPSKTLFDEVRLSGPNKMVTVVFARDTRMGTPFDAEAFGLGNTRTRPWLTHSVWLTSALSDRGIALAHELFHVLVNSGAHTDDPKNLMHAYTSSENRQLTQQQCMLARERAPLLGLTE